jgi:glycosyltransferase involved in cell wall biosynthesis
MPSSHQNTLISLVVPFYDEEEAVSAFFARVVPVLENIPEADYEIICVNDGSRDATLDQLIASSKANRKIHVLDLSRNFGKEAALTAGLDAACGDAIIPIDADLQHPPEIIPEMVKQWRSGYEVVLAKRSNRNTDHPLQRHAANWFYHIHNWLSDSKIPENVGDFRLIDSCVLGAIKRLPERQRFMKGLFAWVGFKTTSIDYMVEPRHSGNSSFNGWKLWNFALEGLTSFSSAPLRVWTYLGGLISFLAFAHALWIVVKTLLYGADLPGYASLLTAILFLGGVQLIGIGVLGEYIGRIYSETKQRPIYIVRKVYGQQDAD